MSWDMRKVYVAATVQMTQTMRPAKENSKRNYSFQYYLKKKGKELQVCKTMFLNTLNLKEWSVRNWVVTSNSGMHGDSKDVNMPTKRRVSCEKKDSLLHMKDFLEKLPKLESHYCRSDTKKLYLETIFQLEAFEDHIRKKNEARAEKTKDKDLAIQNPEEIAVFTMDMQAVKLAPMIRATAIYFKTKLAVHNYTVFNLVTKNVHCYLWHEVEGGLEASPFSVEYLSHDYFLDYTNLSYYDSIRPGVRRHDPTINDLRCIKYEESGISFKANYSDDWKTLQRKPKHIDMNEVIIDALYKDRLKITLEKYHHLQVLKGVLPMDVHSFYDALPHLTTSFKK
ncbi:hypothetical protein RN001_006050 [Aquatica leii]|uniref:Uncharacterized protein n=1 Tax=Aquatica leii TaxID=1421715 RepID=A0AAN7PHX2_9COLE|nr:hypothetical protein RN001_006050 [Aquatica leii]